MGSSPISAMQSITVAEKRFILVFTNQRNDYKSFKSSMNEKAMIITSNLGNASPALSVLTDSIRSQKGIRLWLKQLKGKKSNSD